MDFADNEIDTEDLLQVDYNNIIGDIITFPVIFNRISLIKAEIEDMADRVKMELDVLEAQKYEHHRKRLTYEKEIVTASGKSTGVYKSVEPTDGIITAHVTKDLEVREKRSLYYDVRKQVKILDGLYWSAKSKDKKLDSISAKMTPEDFETKMLEGMVNSVMIRAHKNVIK